MSMLTRTTAYTVRIAATTAATPVLAGAAAASASAKLARCELWQLGRSPLSVQVMQLKAGYRQLAAANGDRRNHANGDRRNHANGDRRNHGSAAAGTRWGTAAAGIAPITRPAHSGQARARLAALNPSR